MRHVLNNHHNQKVLKFTVTYVFYVKISRCESLTMIRVHRSNVESQKPYAPVEMWGCNEIGVEIARVMRKMMNRAHSSQPTSLPASIIDATGAVGATCEILSSRALLAYTSKVIDGIFLLSWHKVASNQHLISFL